MSTDSIDDPEGEIHRLAVKVASDVTPFGLALGEMLRTLGEMDRKLAQACTLARPSSEPDGDE